MYLLEWVQVELLYVLLADDRDIIKGRYRARLVPSSTAAGYPLAPRGQKLSC